MPSEDLVVVKVAPFNAESPTEQLGHDLTPLSSFYVRSNFDVPKIDPVSYHLHVGGKVNQPLALGLDELKALGAVTLTSTLECAGNHRMGLTPMPTGEPWAGGAVSTAQWTGVPLRAVLRRAGIQSDVIEILATGADQGKPKDHPEVISFQRSLPLAKALHPDTLLAYEMNGEPLQPSHGAPLRVVVPGWYGMAGVKWLTRLEAITAPFTGYYQASRYIFDYGDDANPQPVNTIRPKSIIVDPSEGVTVSAGSVLVRGRAWSGAGAITSVEVAVDGGASWKPARLLDEASPYAWRIWEFTWDAADPGRHTLRSRATDEAGNTQPDSARWNRHGYGSNGVRLLTVNVR
jgi:DMSO/TMAO reductase YedYZ molybdopterin-dependent catalytic subunit